MAKLIGYRIIAALQFFLVFFFVMLVSDYTQYDVEMFNIKINTIYEGEYEYLDCMVSDGHTPDDIEFNHSKLQTYWFYDYYQFDLQRTTDLSKISGYYVNPTLVNRLPEGVNWIMGGIPHGPNQIVLGEDLFNLINEHCDQPIAVGSTIRVTVNTLASNDALSPFEVIVSGVYSTDSHVFSSIVQNRHMINQAHNPKFTEEYDDKYNPLNESFYILQGPNNEHVSLNQVKPVRTLVEIPKGRDSLIELYHKNHRVRACIDSFEVDNLPYIYNNGYTPINNLYGHKKFLETSTIVFGIICPIALFLLILFLYASTQLVINRNEDKSLKEIFKRDLLFYALILLGGGLIFTIYTLLFPWVLLVQPIIISLLCFIGIVTIHWLLIFIWQYKELSKE